MNKSYFIKRDNCPCCESTLHKTIYNCRFLDSPIKDYLIFAYPSINQTEFEYLKGVRFILNECRDCGVIYQKEIPNNFLMNKIYEEWIGTPKDLNQTILDFYSAKAREIMMLIAYFNPIKNQLKFFDFGMGWGKWCLMAKAFGCDSYGTELSETRVTYTKAQGIKVISWDDIPNYCFDFINTEQVFEHIPEPLKTLQYLKKALKPNGLIKISVPDGNNIKRKLRRLDWMAPKGSKNSLNPVSPLEHINCFNRSSIINMMDIAGFEMIKIPLITQYIYTTNWKPMKPALINILRPLYRNVFGRDTYLFFRQK